MTLVKQGLRRELNKKEYPFVGASPPPAKGHANNFANHLSGVQFGGSGNKNEAYYSNRSLSKQDNPSKFIVFVIGGVCHQEISALTAFERNQIVNDVWPQERLIMVSTESRPLTGRELLKMLATIGDIDQQMQGQEMAFQRTSHLNFPDQREDEEEEEREDKPSISFNQIDLQEKDEAEAPHLDDSEDGSQRQIQEKITPRTKKRKRKRKVNENVVS